MVTCSNFENKREKHRFLIFKIFNFQFFKNHSPNGSLTQTITIFIKRCSGIFATILKIYLRMKSTYRTIRKYEANPGMMNDFQIASNNMTRSRINVFRILTVSGLRGTYDTGKCIIYQFLATLYIPLTYSNSLQNCCQFVKFKNYIR